MVSKYKVKGIIVGSSVVSICFLLTLIVSRYSLSVQRSSTTNKNIVGNNAQATAVNVTLTPTLTTSTESRPLFSDNFANTSKGWSLSSVPGYTRSIHNSTLTLADANHGILTESLPTNALYDDFMITVSFTLLQANYDDSVGLYVRGDSNLDHDYRVDLFGNSSYAISKELLDTNNIPQVKVLVGQTKTTVLRPVGQQNNVTVAMKGSVLVLLINGNYMNSVVDTDYNAGQIALFVQNGNSSNGVEASFSGVAVYSTPQQLPPN